MLKIPIHKSQITGNIQYQNYNNQNILVPEIGILVIWVCYLFGVWCLGFGIYSGDILFIIYDIIFVFFAILYFPYLIIRGKWHSGFKTRFGCLGPVFAGRLDEQECVWIHAVSVGEVLAIADLLRKVKEAFPQ